MYPASTFLRGPYKSKAQSFLASRVLPVDPLKIRNSLFLTVCGCTFLLPSSGRYISVCYCKQPMRSPAMAAVNIIEREDMPVLEDAAKYKGMEDETDRLQKRRAGDS